MDPKFSNYLTDLRRNITAIDIVNSVYLLFILQSAHANDATNFHITNENLKSKLTLQQQQLRPFQCGFPFKMRLKKSGNLVHEKFEHFEPRCKM